MMIVVCGDRFWTDKTAIENRLKCLNQQEDVVITGGCRGVDTITNNIAKKLNLMCVVVDADWNKFGKSAGPIRNRKMLSMNPDLVIAFHNDIESSKGTKDCITEAKKREIPVEIIKNIPF
jgi:hypothetical protein